MSKHGGADPLPPLPSDWSRGLVVMAHPDDPEYGVSGAVARWVAEGKDVRYALATRGEAGIAGMRPDLCGPLREEEQRRACLQVGVDQLEFLGHPDGRIEYGLKLRRDIAAAIRRHRPEFVITLNHHDTWWPGAWNTPDHTAVGRAVLDAVGDAGNEWIFEDLDAAPWGGVRWVGVASTQPTHRVEITDQYERAVTSLSEHREYLAALSPDPVEQQAREIIDMGSPADDDGRRWLGLELYQF